MSKPSCDACSNLREYNANFIMNGVTDDIAASLANNTGLNACLTDLHTDCEDLNDVNDCLIGHMDDDVDNYEVCDWKSLAHNFFPNLYETLKAMIAAICGLWTKTGMIEKLVNENTTAICGLTESDKYIPITFVNSEGLYGNLRIRTVQLPEACGGGYRSTLRVNVYSEADTHSVTLDDADAAGRRYFGYINKSDLVPEYMTEELFTELLSGGPSCLIPVGSGLMVTLLTGYVTSLSGPNSTVVYDDTKLALLGGIMVGDTLSGTKRLYSMVASGDLDKYHK